MITQKQLDKNLHNLDETNDTIGFPSIAAICGYHDYGEDDKNALEYENAYISLIEQVKDKSHDEQVAHLMAHMDELRDIVTLFSSARDMYIYDEGDFCDEVLANLMIYRYENHISVLDDEYCKLTKDYLQTVEDRLYSKMADEIIKQSEEDVRLEREYKKTHPEEARALHEQRIRKDIEIAKNLDKIGEEMIKEHGAEYLIYGH